MGGIFEADADNISKAAELIKSGKLVAFPTETVYGLGASVYDAKAVAGIFAAKGRPAFNPLISHIAEPDELAGYAAADQRALFLARKFWPGPLTFVLPRKDENPALDLVCAGLKTITVRCPRHPAALELIRKSGVPIAAPSANRSQTISPTTAQAVYESLGDRVDMILDGGSCTVGVESTILDLTTRQAVLLRAGGITREELEEGLAWADAVVAGPGLGRSDEALSFMNRLLEQNKKPLVIDGDGIYLARQCKRKLPSGTIITPHLKELEGFAEVSVIGHPEKLPQIVSGLAADQGIIVVGKDAKTVVSNGQECYINDTGNNGMATGGSGDVLAGMTAGLLAQKMDSFEAAKLAVYLHGAAGDVMKEKKSSYSLLATDLLEGISELLSNLEA